MIILTHLILDDNLCSIGFVSKYYQCLNNAIKEVEIIEIIISSSNYQQIDGNLFNIWFWQNSVKHK